MILGLGIDICDIREVDKNREAILRHFTIDEIKLAKSRPTYLNTLAKRMAVKEAVFKALGGGYNVQLIDIEVRQQPSGKPYAVLHREAAARLLEISQGKDVQASVEIAVSDEGLIAAAVALIHADLPS